VLSDDVAVFWCAWRSRESYCDGNAPCWCTVFRCEEFDACHRDCRLARSTGYGSPDDSNCKALDDQEVLRIETLKWETKCSDTEGEFTRKLVLATSPNSRVGSGFGYSNNRTVATGLITRKPRPVGYWLVLSPKTRHFNITSLPQIKYWSSDCIMTWSVRRLCRSSRSFTSQSQICHMTNIRWVANENRLVSFRICPFFTATQWISVGSQIGKR